MKNLLAFLFVFMGITTFAQSSTEPQSSWGGVSERKGQNYFYWGYNRGFYSRSDINFKGADYNFTLYDVKAKDRQSKLGADPYLHINQLTIPQYDYRLGYCFNDKYSLSIGFDHMKYVVNDFQTTHISGTISGQVSSPAIPVNPAYVGNFSNAKRGILVTT